MSENISPSTPRGSILEYVDDSDDSHKNPNYCPSSDSGDDQENVHDHTYNVLVGANETEQEEARDKENEETQDIQEEVEQKKSQENVRSTSRQYKKKKATLRGVYDKKR